MSEDIGKIVVVDEGYRTLKTIVTGTRKSIKIRDGIAGHKMYLVKPIAPHDHIAPFWIFKPGTNHSLFAHGLTYETITDEQISALRREADTAGDHEMARICSCALTSDITSMSGMNARAQCAKAINAARARAMED